MKKALLFSLVLFLVSCSNITSSSFNSEVSKSSTSSIDSHVDTEDPKPNTSSSSIDNKSYLKDLLPWINDLSINSIKKVKTANYIGSGQGESLFSNVNTFYESENQNEIKETIDWLNGVVIEKSNDQWTPGSSSQSLTIELVNQDHSLSISDNLFKIDDDYYSTSASFPTYQELVYYSFAPQAISDIKVIEMGSEDVTNDFNVSALQDMMFKPCDSVLYLDDGFNEYNSYKFRNDSSEFIQFVSEKQFNINGNKYYEIINDCSFSDIKKEPLKQFEPRLDDLKESVYYYSDYCSSINEEYLRIYENNIAYFEGPSFYFVANISYFNNSFALTPYIFCSLDGQPQYLYETSNYFHLVFELTKSGPKYLSDFSYDETLKISGSTFKFIGEGNVIPEYHYKKRECHSFNVHFRIIGVFNDQEKLLNELGLEEYSSNVSSYYTYKNSNETSLSLKFPIEDYFKKYKELSTTDLSKLDGAISFGFDSTVDDIVYNKQPNAQYHGLSNEYRINEAYICDILEVSVRQVDNVTSNIISSAADLAIYFSSLSNISVNYRDENGSKYINIANYIDYFDTSIFESMNIVVLGIIQSPSTVDEYQFSSAYLKDNKLSVLFNSEPNASGFAMLTYRLYVLALPKDCSFSDLEIIG